MNARKNALQAGFTLVELIIVILILGILVSVALPKFINLGGDARYAKIQGIQGSIKSAMAIVNGAAMVRGLSSAATGNLTMADGTTVTMIYGYPDVNNLTGIGAAAGFSAAAANNPDGLNVTINGSATPPNMQIYPVNAQTSTSCTLTYTVATATAGATVSLSNGAANTTC